MNVANLLIEKLVTGQGDLEKVLPLEPLFFGQDKTALTYIKNHYDRHGKLPTLGLFRLNFPEEAYKLNPWNETANFNELVAYGQEKNLSMQMGIQVSNIVDAHDAGDLARADQLFREWSDRPVTGQSEFEFDFWTFEELSDDEFTYRIDGLLPTGSNVILSAYAKSGKTTLIMDLLRAFTSHDDFLSSFTCSTTAGRVVYVNLELDETMLREYATDNGIDLANDKLRVLNLRGRASKLKVLEPAFRKQFAQQLIDIDCEVLVIDPLSPILAMMGIDSNDNDRVREVLEGLGEIAAEACLEHLIIVDHTGHDDKGRTRGASAKLDWPDVTWNIKTDENRGTRKFTAFGRRVDNSFNLVRNPDTNRLETTIVVRDVDGGDWVIFSTRMQPGQRYTTTQLLEITGMTKPTLNRRLKEYEAAGKLKRIPSPVRTQPDEWEISVSHGEMHL